MSYALISGNVIPAITGGVFNYASTQDGTLIEDEADMFLAQFGEDVVYYPKDGTPRNIKAIVDRNPVAGMPGFTHGNAPKISVAVKNDSDAGISSTEINTGGDKIGLDIRIGETDQQRRIASVMWQDAGMMYLGL